MDVELRSGSRLGRYELLVALGTGGMATVWIARESSDVGDRLVAVKAMLPELARQPQFRTMFLEEGQVVRSIEHQNIVRVHEVGEDRGILFMAMEWVRGDSLLTIIREATKRKPIPAEVAVRIIADTAAGLHAAHELRGWDGELRNLVHCDVSPHNILVGVDGRARLVDFGVANGTAYSDPDSGDQVKGKFGYMSPEQAEGLRVDRRSDIFSLGIVLFELTTGERLFKGETPAQTIRLVSAARIPSPQRIFPGYPERLAPIVMKALARETKERFQSADEFRQALEGFLVEERLMVTPSAVGKLVYKVLKPRLDNQDEQLRKALVAADGMFRAGLVPSTRATGGSGEHAAARASRFSDPPTSSNPNGSPGPFHSSVPQRPRRTPIGAVLFGAFGVTCAVASIVYTSLQQKPNALVTAPGTVATAKTGAAATVQTSVANNGVSLDSIPLAERDTTPRAAATTRPARVDLEEDPEPPKPEATDEAPKEKPATEVGTAKTNHPPLGAAMTAAVAPSSPAPEPSATSDVTKIDLEEQEAPKPATPPPMDQRQPFSLGAARSALAAATNRANACSSPDGPSGQGRAMITFSSDGPVSSVSLPAPFSGTSVGSCIAAAFRSARVPAYTGSTVTLPQTFRIP